MVLPNNIKYTEFSGDELCRMAILLATEETSDWINTVVGLYYRFQPHYKEKPFYAGIAITERLLADFIRHGLMPETDMDLPFGFTKEAREKMDVRAKEFFRRNEVV